ERLKQDNRRLDAKAAQLTRLRADVETVQGRLRQAQARAESLEAERDRLHQNNLRLGAMAAQLASLEIEHKKLKGSAAKTEEERKRLSLENEALTRITAENRDAQGRLLAA